jgi:hypothetical protein
MYIFVRFSAVVTIILGVLLMLVSLVGAAYGFFQNDAVTLAINNALEAANDMRRVVNAGYAGLILGAIVFVIGMFTAAFGQLLLVFVDMATNTRETNLILLRSLRARSSEKQAVTQEYQFRPYAEEEPAGIEKNASNV